MGEFLDFRVVDQCGELDTYLVEWSRAARCFSLVLPTLELNPLRGGRRRYFGCRVSGPVLSINLFSRLFRVPGSCC